MSVPIISAQTTRSLIYFYDLLTLVKHLNGDIVECGIGRGDTLSELSVLSSLFDKERHIYGFDSFQGLPEPSKEDGAVGSTPQLKSGSFAFSIVAPVGSAPVTTSLRESAPTNAVSVKPTPLRCAFLRTASHRSALAMLALQDSDRSDRPIHLRVGGVQEKLVCAIKVDSDEMRTMQLGKAKAGFKQTCSAEVSPSEDHRCSLSV